MRVFARNEVKKMDAANVQGWLADNGCIARQETEYIDRSDDVMTLQGSGNDFALDAVARPVEQLLLRLPTRLTTVSAQP